MDRVDAVVIGGGVVGLAVARALALTRRETLLLEAAAECGTGISSRSSEVIHAGLYYPPGSLKARLCRAGREQLYGFAAEREVPYRRCGKLVVATSAGELEKLAALARTAQANDVAVHPLDARAARALEPELACEAALLSPDTGIIDSHAYVLALRAEAEREGVIIACRSRVTGWTLAGGASRLSINHQEASLEAALVVNCAGLQALEVAALIADYPAALLPRAYLAKGNYFALRGASPFRHLIYPLPEGGGLGIHLTLDLAGGARFGPDVQWVAEPDYRVDATRAGLFAAAIRHYWPALPADALLPGYAGLRPKIAPPEQAWADFRIDGPALHGLPLVQLFGIESPGLTAALAIGEYVARLSG